MTADTAWLLVFRYTEANITTKINFSQPGGVNVILQTMRQIDATQNKAVPDDPYARLFKAAPSC